MAASLRQKLMPPPHYYDASDVGVNERANMMVSCLVDCYGWGYRCEWSQF